MNSAEAIALKQIRDGRLSAGFVTLIGRDEFYSLVFSTCSRIISQEVKAYSQGKSMLSLTSAEDLRQFDLDSVGKELRDRMPRTYQVVDAITLREHESKMKTHEYVRPAVTSVLCKCLSIYSDRLSAYRYLISSVLASGGTKHQTMDQLARLYDVMSNTARDNKQSDYVQIFNTIKLEWKRRPKPFQVVFDNVDKHLSRRQQSKDVTNTLCHMVQALCVGDRVMAPPGSPQTAIDEVTTEQLLVSQADRASVVSRMVYVVRDIWSKLIPALAWMKPPRYTHDYSAEMKAKSEKVFWLFYIL